MFWEQIPWKFHDPIVKPWDLIHYDRWSDTDEDSPQPLVEMSPLEDSPPKVLLAGGTDFEIAGDQRVPREIPTQEDAQTSTIAFELVGL